MPQPNAGISIADDSISRSSERAGLSANLMIHLLAAGPTIAGSPDELANMTPALFKSLRTLTRDLTSSAIEDARGQLDVALEGLECDISVEKLRCLIERVDDTLRALQGWTTLAANARTYLKHPALG